ncbi:MAG TPA: hypothetical protein VFY10_15835 [Dehalococcoidia bacterium]|nr:hypothetical protein [Dehalococcoidia bacterium]
MTNRFERARDLRQLRFMLSTLRSYSEGASSLPRLVEDIDLLLLSLSGADGGFEAKVRAALPAPDTKSSSAKRAVSKLMRLVEDAIKRHEREQPDV